MDANEAGLGLGPGMWIWILLSNTHKYECSEKDKYAVHPVLVHVCDKAISENRSMSLCYC